MAEPKMPATLRELLKQLDEMNVTDARRYAAIRRFLGFKAREKGIPLSGTFELTPICNLDCKMCYVHLNREQMQSAEILPMETWKSIMKSAVDAGMLYARLTGGECLTYPGFKELYLYLRAQGIEVTVLSNGILMTEEMVSFLSENPPASVQISLYGASEEAYERVTGHRAFATVTENLKRLQKAQIPLSIAVTPNSCMTDGENILDYLFENGFPYQINSGILAPREETGRGLLEAPDETYAALLKHRRKQYGSGDEPECDPESLPDEGSANKVSQEGVRCGAGRSSFSVDWRGGMRPCNTFPCEPQSVIELGFAEAWKKTNNIANHFKRPAECEGCAYREACKSCVAEHASGAPVGQANPAVCRRTKYLIAEGLLKLQKL